MIFGRQRVAVSDVRPAPRHRRPNTPQFAAAGPVSASAPVRPVEQVIAVPAARPSATAPVSVTARPAPYLPPFRPAASRPAEQAAPAVTAVLRQPTGPIRNLADLDAALAREDRPEPPIYLALVAAFGFDPAPTQPNVPVVPGPWFGGTR